MPRVLILPTTVFIGDAKSAYPNLSSANDNERFKEISSFLVQHINSTHVEKTTQQASLSTGNVSALRPGQKRKR